MSAAPPTTPNRGVALGFIKAWHREYANALGTALMVSLASPIIYGWYSAQDEQWTREFAARWTAVCFYCALVPALVKGQHFGAAFAWLIGLWPVLTNLWILDSEGVDSEWVLLYAGLVVLIAPSILIRVEAKRDRGVGLIRGPLVELGIVYLPWAMLAGFSWWFVSLLAETARWLIDTCLWSLPIAVLRKTGRYDENRPVASVALFWCRVLVAASVSVGLVLVGLRALQVID